MQKNLHMLQKESKKAWDPKSTYIRWVYISIVCPTLIYANLSWGHITRFPSKHTALDKLNCLAATLITPFGVLPQSKPWKSYMTLSHFTSLFIMKPLNLYPVIHIVSPWYGQAIIHHIKPILDTVNSGMTHYSLPNYPFPPWIVIGLKLTISHLTVSIQLSIPLSPK